MFDISATSAGAHGVWVAVTLPDSADPVADHVLARLPPTEAQFARALGGYRQPAFVGGRLALHAALAAVGGPADAPSLPDDRGAPTLPSGWVGSISHKRTLAIAMVAHPNEGTLGIDLETRLPARESVANRVLTAEELQAIEDLPRDRRWTALLLRFSMKEAIYKALDPYVRRFVGFHEAEVTLQRDGLANASLRLTGQEGPFHLDCRYMWLPDHVLTSVRIRKHG